MKFPTMAVEVNAHHHQQWTEVPFFHLLINVFYPLSV